MHSVARIFLWVGLAFSGLTEPARADYCHDWLATLSRTIDMNLDTNVGTGSGLHVAMHTQAKGYEVILHCKSEVLPKWITISTPAMSPPDDWFYTIARIGVALQGWKAEELDKALRKCHHDAAIKSDGYRSPPGLECWVSDKKSMVAVWPPGAK
ncbi:hypothetical protein [Bradyrhizobium sp. BR 1433]|uniref:hypothetical protein n=1 Tax=Bradyrhizobium sp. BR 1433 TaxID=3447967 RepID=UPI003EE63521